MSRAKSGTVGLAVRVMGARGGEPGEESEVDLLLIAREGTRSSGR
jgi:hypothetical protein